MEFVDEGDPKMEEIPADKNWDNNVISDDDDYSQEEKMKKPQGTDKGCKLKFELITKFFNRSNELKGKKKTEFVKKFLQEFLFKKERSSAFPLMRLILPHLDRERNTYGLKEIALGKLVADAFGLPQSEIQRIRFYKNPSYHPHGSPVGDFVGVMHSVIKDLCKGKSDLSVDDVNQFLDNLCHSDNHQKQIEIMTRLMQRCSADDIYWIARIILKDLKIGLRHEKVFPIFHPDALDLYNVTSNLREVCKELQDPQKKIGSNIFRPMLAGKKTADELRSILAGTEILIETKFDGERIQVHFNENEMKFFSRNSNDYTHIYTPKLGKVLRENLTASAGILDGEIVVLEKGTWNAVQFGMNKTVAMEEEDGDFQLCYMIFDILYVKGPKGEECNLMTVGLKDRKMVLKRVIKHIPHVLEIVSGVETTDIERVFIEFDKAMIRNEEGIIVKRLNSIYSPNDRGIDWIKLKGEYVEGMIDTLDLLIIGGYFGEGRVRIGVTLF